MELSDERLSTGVPGNLHLEEAFLYVLEQFRKTYVCEHIQKMSVVYEILEKNLGLQDENALLTIFVRKMWVHLTFSFHCFLLKILSRLQSDYTVLFV